MVRKQLYIEDEQEQKVRRLAASWGCTEAQVIRTALDRLPDPDASIEDRLSAAGLLAPPPSFDDALDGAELEALEAELEAWLERQPTSLGLTEAVLEDRR